MKKFMLIGLLIVLALSASAALAAGPDQAVQAPNLKSETCPEGDGWVKYDGLSGLSFTMPSDDIPDGYYVTDNCYKAGNTVVYGSGDTVESTVWNKDGCPGKRGCAYQELSHASFKLESSGDDDTGDDTGDDDTGDDTGDDDTGDDTGDDDTGDDDDDEGAGKIWGFKFNDLDGDGYWEDGETAMSGWEIILKNGEGQVIGTDTTDGEGVFKFPGLGSGSYIVCEEGQSGWVQTRPDDPVCYQIELGSEQVIRLVLGNMQVGDDDVGDDDIGDDDTGDDTGDDDTGGDDDDDVYILQYCLDGQRVFLDSRTAGDLTPIKDEDPCEPVLPALGPVEAVAPAAGGIAIDPLLVGGVGLSLLGAARLAYALLKRR